MELFEIFPRVFSTGAVFFDIPSFSQIPSSWAAPLTKVMAEEVTERPNDPNIGRKCAGCGVGIEALGSPIIPPAIVPPTRTISGFVPKNAGVQTTKSALFPTSTEPTYFETP